MTLPGTRVQVVTTHHHYGRRPYLSTQAANKQGIRAITEQLGASPDHYWYHDFKRVDGWEQFIEDAARPREGEEETLTGDTVLVMNAGAHVSIYPSLFCRY